MGNELNEDHRRLSDMEPGELEDVYFDESAIRGVVCEAASSIAFTDAGGHMRVLLTVHKGRIEGDHHDRKLPLKEHYDDEPTFVALLLDPEAARTIAMQLSQGVFQISAIANGN